MSNTSTLAIGHYSETDTKANETELHAVTLASPKDIASLEAGTRENIRVVAFQGHDHFDKESMALLPSLELISNFGVGYDPIDVQEATRRGIRVTNTPDVLTDDVADMGVALLLAQGRRMVQASDWVRSGDWGQHGEIRLSTKISGGKVGIVGLGRIGREIANRLSAFKMDIHYHSRSSKDTPGWTFHEDPVALAKAVDFLVVALVGGEQTQGYVSADVINALGPQGILVNVSRGTTIDEPALLTALESGAIAGAGLDVFLNEPHPDSRFLALDNVLMQPHHSSGTIATRAAMGKLQRDNVLAHYAGNALLTPVN